MQFIVDKRARLVNESRLLMPLSEGHHLRKRCCEADLDLILLIGDLAQNHYLLCKRQVQFTTECEDAT